MGLIIRILISAAAVFVAAYFLPNVTLPGGIGSALVVAIVLGLLNAFIRPILVILTIPVTILTLGLFLLVINVIMVYLADSFIDGFQIAGSGISYFITALIFSFVVSIITYLLDAVVN